MKGILIGIITFIITTLIIPIVIITSCSIDIPAIEKHKQTREIEAVESDLIIKVYNHKTNRVMELYLEEYILNVVAAEMPASFEIEALKAQAVAARTYAIWKLKGFNDKGNTQHPSAPLCTNHTHCQEWLSTDELRERHGRLWMYQYWGKLEEAVESTTGIILTYNMNPIEPLYHSTSGGKTENSEDVFSSEVPYLRSVSSPYEERSPVLVDKQQVTIEKFISDLKKRRRDIKLSSSNLEGQIEILERSSGGSIKRITIGNEEFTGRELREIFQLRSADFTIKVTGSNVEFTTKGYGHGVGMSQWGANGMAERGANYQEILEHYYQGTILSKIKSYL
ncbi:stage II sporulation protein D [Alkaliphilus peptidifermentans]|uniref:Stage II sporulation protein D n=1 Tax=Alkaliphilus peptidifermentans DSM 18978 TaxID=1120976 RepID=A0A1G5JG46_9FIRM|nr:stage II sporulation protein D [Alkaliphilus peptidifermentans]SCY87267.1 stage II sporulation protein D [Alkaliphilus peptidifermentans DSM 18978]